MRGRGWSKVAGCYIHHTRYHCKIMSMYMTCAILSHPTDPVGSGQAAHAATHAATQNATLTHVMKVKNEMM